MIDYFVESFKSHSDKPLLVRSKNGNLFEKYVYEQNKWVYDKYLLGICVGEILVDDISEAEAKAIISQNS